MIDSDYYVDNTDEMFGASSTGTVGQGFKTLLKHFITSFLLFLSIAVLFLSTYVVINVEAYDEDDVVLEYFKNTKSHGVQIYGYDSNEFQDEMPYLEDKLFKHNYTTVYQLPNGLYDQSNIYNLYEVNSIDGRSRRAIFGFDFAVNAMDFDVDGMGFEMLGGILPNNNNQVAITKFQFDLYRERGYSDRGSEVKIETVDDIIGKEAFGRTIVGVVDTKYSFEYKDTTNMTQNEKREYDRDLETAIYGGVHHCLILYNNRPIRNVNWRISKVYVAMNHNEDDMVFLDINRDHYLEKTKFYAYNGDDWGEVDKVGLRKMFMLIIASCIGLGIITSLILGAVSFKDKKESLIKLVKREYSAKDCVGMFAPEILILVISAIIINIITIGVFVLLFKDLDAEAPTYLYSGAVPLAIVAMLGELCAILAFAFGGVTLKIKRKFKNQFKDKIEDKVVDRYY